MNPTSSNSFEPPDRQHFSLVLPLWHVDDATS